MCSYVCVCTSKALAELRGKVEEIPCVIGGKEVITGKTRDQLCVSVYQLLIVSW